jgi:hypothetical protein
MADKLTEGELRALLLSFLGSLTLCDHMSDVMQDCRSVIDRLGLGKNLSSIEELADLLRPMGVKTLYGTDI